MQGPGSKSKDFFTAIVTPGNHQEDAASQQPIPTEPISPDVEYSGTVRDTFSAFAGENPLENIPKLGRLAKTGSKSRSAVDMRPNLPSFLTDERPISHESACRPRNTQARQKSKSPTWLNEPLSAVRKSQSFSSLADFEDPPPSVKSGPDYDFLREHRTSPMPSDNPFAKMKATSPGLRNKRSQSAIPSSRSQRANPRPRAASARSGRSLFLDKSEHESASLMDSKPRGSNSRAPRLRSRDGQSRGDWQRDASFSSLMGLDDATDPLPMAMTARFPVKASVRESFASLEKFVGQQRGRVGVKTTTRAVENTAAPTEALSEHRSNDAQGFEIPYEPAGRMFRMNIHTTWGDQHYVGLTGIQFFDTSGSEIRAFAAVRADPADINVLGGDTKDPRVISNVVDGVNRTCDDTHMWLAPYYKGMDHIIDIEFVTPVTLALIRVWNYNKSRVHTARGARMVSMFLDGIPIFEVNSLSPNVC